MTYSKKKPTNYINEELESMKNYKIIPQEKEFNKKCISDLVYGYLQINSYKGKTVDGEEISFVYKTPTLVSEISKATSIPNLKVRRKIDKLLNNGFIKEEKVIDIYDKEVNAYAFKSVKLYQKINLETLKFLVDSANDNVIKVYCYLLGKCANVNPQYEFTKKELIIEVLGIKDDSHKRDREATGNIIKMLCLSGLLVLYDKRVLRNIVGGAFTSYYKISKINLKIKDPKCDKLETKQFLEDLDKGKYDGVDELEF